MPSEVSDIKQFLEIARRKDATGALIKHSRFMVEVQHHEINESGKEKWKELLANEGLCE